MVDLIPGPVIACDRVERLGEEVRDADLHSAALLTIEAHGEWPDLGAFDTGSQVRGH